VGKRQKAKVGKVKVGKGFTGIETIFYYLTNKLSRCLYGSGLQIPNSVGIQLIYSTFSTKIEKNKVIRF